MDQEQKDALTVATGKPSLNQKVNVPLKNCKVVLDNISMWGCHTQGKCLK